MPSRIVREGINSSARVNRLSFGAELLYRRLMSVADDYGRFYASPVTIRASCWPLCPEKVTEKNITEWLIECLQGDKPLLSGYEVDGAKYILIQDFGQQIRTKSKFPEPVGFCKQPDIRIKSNRLRPAKGSRSRISESEAKPIPEPTLRDAISAIRGGQSPHQPELYAVDRLVGECAERMYAAHPKKKNMMLVPTALRSAINGAPNVLEFLIEVESCHGEWAATTAWNEKGGNFAPKLDEWIADRGFTKRPNSAPKPQPKIDPSKVVPYEPFKDRTAEKAEEARLEAENAALNEAAFKIALAQVRAQNSK